jgi:DNA adenine methylase
VIAEAERSQAVEKANYVGNKRRLAKYIVGKFPEDGKTAFDPMCGCSAVLIEAARRGYRVKGNDLSIVPYWYSKGVFEGRPLSEEDVEELVGAPMMEGWLTREWEGVYPRPWQVRRYLDGLAKRTREWSGPKGWAAKAVASRVLQTLYSDSISGYSTRRYEALPKVRDVVRRAAKEVSDYAGEVAGKGEITNENAKGMRFPRADVVYFDPPFFKRDKGYVHYFQTYKIMNSILLGRAWEEENMGPEDIPPILEKLCKGCRHIFISTSSNEAVPYARELSRHKRTMKRYRVAYTQTSGFGSRDSHQREHLYVAKANGESVDPYLQLPAEDQTFRYVVQEHFRGRSVHADLRFESPGREALLGWTLSTGLPDALPQPVTTPEEADAVSSEAISRINWESGEFRDPDGQVLAFPKDPHGPEWLEFEGVIEWPDEGRPPEPGATANFPGVLRIVDTGVLEYGVQRDGFHEYFLVSDQEDGGLHGRHIFRRLPPSDGQGERWLLARPDEQIPFVLGEEAVAQGWVPPAGFSALPVAIRTAIPESLQYWPLQDADARRKVRDALAEAIREGLGKGAPSGDEFEKRKLVPFNQWGGSAKYASALSKRLPEHKRYVEPFCGSAAIFFAKEPATESVLADVDPEVVFALKYIQHLTPQGFEALKRFSWKVSRAGYKRAKECEPQSDSERFWRLVYGRLCAWGGRPQMSGYSTIHEGQAYDLEELWKFQEKLKGARIARKDWKETVGECDGAGTLFFLDPPYVGEWGTNEGIPPEDIAQAATKLKGDFLIAYTDSARARRAFGPVGRLFKMKLLEARNHGLWAKRNRLFVASFAIQKSDDLEFIEEVLACAR